ncbi:MULTISPECIES: hypothetical protein [Citrobacter]|uniref:hypothetical protein n=1 Tax=Citrobacter TaxID=544 RepID=UPI002575688B|nr:MULTISPECIES: hypothetical protein [Citrobacter]MDM3324300.1 hypothetical protein [Citrobacter sp. Cb080]MEB8066524.1 hypothetical protein [Citrobacter braakii]
MMGIDNIIISGIRIYFPPDNVLPEPSKDMLTFAVVFDADTLKQYLLLVHKENKWQMATQQLFGSTAQAITAATKIGKRIWQ